MPKDFKGVMHEWKQGKLHSGSRKGPQVKNQDQALAIAFSEDKKYKGDSSSSSSSSDTGQATQKEKTAKRKKKKRRSSSENFFADKSASSEKTPPKKKSKNTGMMFGRSQKPSGGMMFGGRA